MFDVEDLIIYTSSDGYSETYRVVDTRKIPDTTIPSYQEVRLFVAKQGKMTIPLNEQYSIGWFPEVTFAGKQYSIEKFTLPYDPKQQPDCEDDI